MEAVMSVIVRSAALLMALSMVLALTGCGTMSGIGYGAGEVLNGMGEDFRALGDLLDR